MRSANLVAVLLNQSPSPPGSLNPVPPDPMGRIRGRIRGMPPFNNEEKNMILSYLIPGVDMGKQYGKQYVTQPMWGLRSLPMSKSPARLQRVKDSLAPTHGRVMVQCNHLRQYIKNTPRSTSFKYYIYTYIPPQSSQVTLPTNLVNLA